jgi:pilus assembly protein CpaB
LGVILALVTAGAVYVLLSGMGGGQEVVEVEREEVLVAIQPIAEDEPIEGRVDVRSIPVETIPEGALRTAEGVSGLLAAGPIPQGAVIHPDLLISPEELAREGELSKLLEPGFVAVAFPIDEQSSVSYGLRPGDHVDILMTFYFLDLDQETQTQQPICPPLCPGRTEEQEAGLREAQRPRLVAQLTLQDIEVLGVGRWGQEVPTQEEEAQAQRGEPVQAEPPKYITFMISPQDALVLKLAREYGASIDLAVRAEEDMQQFATQEVTLDYIMARFGINLPGRQPYTIENIDRLQQPQSEF